MQRRVWTPVNHLLLALHSTSSLAFQQPPTTRRVLRKMSSAAAATAAAAASAPVAVAVPDTTKALYLTSFIKGIDALPSMTASSRPTPLALGASDVLLHVRSASVNPSDVKNSLGQMTSTRLPRVLGRDFAGSVVRAGEAADAQALLGRDVFGTGGDLGFTVDGTHSEYVRLPASAVTPMPRGLTTDEAASLGVTFCTAAHGLARGRLTADDIVLVTGANGGVGSAVVQLAKQAGAKVIAVLRSKPRGGDAVTATAESTRFGTPDAHIYLSELPGGFADLPRAVRDLPLIRAAFADAPIGDDHHRHGPSLIFDVLGGDAVIPHLLASLATRGRLVNIAQPLPHTTPIGVNGLELYRQELEYIGVNSLLLSAVDCATILRRLAPHFESGLLVPSRGGTTQLVSIERIGQAYADVITGKAKGKIVIDFSASE